ncbi:dimethylsulfonioproprionate lyase family protein [Roseovarius sp. D0-M9]|uniref:dimethylsulfonioproprionate lyase family protein n=1 Tax=Roseovarius sp. D0-M9 TaxID=3127117 RepID=UPI00300F7BF6
MPKVHEMSEDTPPATTGAADDTQTGASGAIGAHSEAQRLTDNPDWLYLLREFDSLYRFGSDGGSSEIRSHRKRVRDSLSATIASNPPILPRTPEARPVTAHLPRALDLGERAAMQGMARALREVRGALTWEYGYEQLPKALARKYAFCEIVGHKGPVQSDRLNLGFVLFAPNTTYPQHSHQDIEESYISISGAWSENNGAVYAPGSLIFNRSGAEHRITTGDRDPCLLAYAWVGPANRLAAPGMKLSPTRRPKAV